MRVAAFLRVLSGISRSKGGPFAVESPEPLYKIQYAGQGLRLNLAMLKGQSWQCTGYSSLLRFF
jgi:hypothetical protein